MCSFLASHRLLAVAVAFPLFSGCGSDAPEGGPLLIAFSADTADPERRHVYTNLPDGSALHRVSAQYVPQVNDSFGWRPGASELSILANEPGTPPRRLLLNAADGSNLRDVTGGLGAQSTAHQSEWSPDGTRIAVQVLGVSIETSEVYICAAPDFACLKASGEIDETGGAWLAGWSPDGRRLAYVERQDESSAQELYTCALDGSDRQRVNRGLQEGTNIQPFEVAWSPNGLWLAYVTYQEAYGLYIGAADGSSNSRASNDDTFLIEKFEWAPAGARIAFRGFETGRVDLFTNVPGDSEPVRVTEHLSSPSFVSDFRWSPDGTRFAYIGAQDVAMAEQLLELRTCMADGSEPLVVKPGGPTSEFEWSPSSDHLAFTWTNPDTDVFELYTSTPGGSEVTQIGGSLALAPYPGAFHLAWSPDGARLAFKATLEPLTEIGLFTARFDGSDLAPIGARTPDGITHLWSPDGSRIAYTVLGGSVMQPAAAIFTNAPDGSDEQQVNDPAEPLLNIWDLAWSRPRGNR